MCGIYGWSFKGNGKGVGGAQREALSSVLAIGNSYRGSHSWGAYLIGKDRKSTVQRHVGDIARADVAWMGHNPIVMAHTRHATTGAVTVDNAHPFTVGKITLAHNGVVFNHWTLETKHNRKCPVDSLHFAHHIAEGKDLSDIEGYGALEWVDSDKPDTIFLCRLSGGSLSVYGLKNERGKRIGVVWSSDKRHIESAVGAARVDAFAYEDLVEGQVYSVKAGRLFVETGRTYALAPSTVSGGTYRLYQSRTSGGESRSRYSGGWEHGIDRDTLVSSRGVAYKWDKAKETWEAVGDEEDDLFERYARADFERLTSGEGTYNPNDPDVDAGLERLAGLTPVDGGMWVNEKGEIVELDEAEEQLWIAGAKTGGEQ